MSHDSHGSAARPADDSPADQPSILKEFRETRQLLWKTWGPVGTVVLLGFIVAWFFVEPAPPRTIKIAAGSQGGAYYRYAQQYAELFAENGYQLEVIETAGSIENYQLLLDDNDIELAITQGGTRPGNVAEDQLEAIACLYFEPLWVFSREPLNDGRFRSLAGKTVAVGAAESGTRAIMQTLLRANGLLINSGESGDAADTTDQISTVNVGGQDAIALLDSGELDAAAFVLPAGHRLVTELLGNADLHVLQIDRAEAYQQLFPYLSDVTLYRGVLDLQSDLPREDLHVIAPVANLICTPEMHDAFVPLLIEAAIKNHSQGTLLVPQGKFPSLEYAEFKPHPAAQDYFRYGPSFLQRYVPFWVASTFDRLKIMLLPLITLAFPLIKLAPPIYRWQIRARIYRWYDLLRVVDQQHNQRSPELVQQHLATLQKMQDELKEIKVPLSYMEEFYNLHLHIELVKRRLLSPLGSDAVSQQGIEQLGSEN